VNRPKILILDEANTSLDEDGDQLLRQVVQSLHGKVTVVFVTHRPSIQELADVSYELIDGLLLPKAMLSLPRNTTNKDGESLTIDIEESPAPKTESTPEVETKTLKAKKSARRKKGQIVKATKETGES